MGISDSKTIPCSHCNGTGSIILPPEIATVEAYYFGCQRESGHYWWPSEYAHGRVTDRDARLIVGPNIHPKIDSGFCPKRDVQGHAKLTEVEGWTILSFWDNSVDRRPGSSSSFVARGIWTFDAMKAIAEAQFPRVWRRFTFAIVLVE